MADLWAYDAAYSPNLDAVVSHGGIAINGYLTGTYAETTTQPSEAHAHGLGYIPTYERGRDELVGATRDHGRYVGGVILAAFRAKGIPLDGTVAAYPSVDVNVSAGRATSCNDGWRGLGDVLRGKVSLRAYAEGAVIDALFDAGLVDGKCWLAAPTSWPGYDPDDPRVCMVQFVGTNVASTDRNLVTDAHALGAWWPDGSEFKGDEPLTDDEIDKIAARVWAHGIEFNNEKHRAETWVAQSRNNAANARDYAREARNKADSALRVLGAAGSGVADQVAGIGARLKTVADAVAALKPAKIEAADADTVAAAVVAKIRALTFGAK